MYSQENYQWGLVIYGLGFLFMLPLVWQVTRFVIPWSPPRTLIRLLFITLVLTPIIAYPGMPFLAPAWIVAVFEFIQPSSVEGPARAVAPMVACYVALVFLYILWALVTRKKKPKRQAQPSQEPAAE